MASLSQLENIENFILEVVRMHPPAFMMFGEACMDFVLKARLGSFNIKKGSLICGNIYQIQRDASIFQNPNNFEFDRFTRNPELKRYLVAFGGDYLHEQDILSHKCIGQHMTLSVMKICVSHMLFCTLEFASNVKWTQTKIKRYSASDKPVVMSIFSYNGYKSEEVILDEVDVSDDTWCEET